MNAINAYTQIFPDVDTQEILQKILLKKLCVFWMKNLNGN